MIKTLATNDRTKRLLISLEKSARENKAPIWSAVARDLSRKGRHGEVHVSDIDAYSCDGETVLIPGKVLSSGELTKKVAVAAWKFSGASKSKIAKKGSVMSIEELLKKNPKGSKVRILK